VVTMGGRDFSKLLPGTRSTSVEELARQQGVRTVESADDTSDLWDADEELGSSLPTSGHPVRPTLPGSGVVASLIIKGRGQPLAPQLAGRTWCVSFVTVGELVRGRSCRAGAC